MVAAHPRPRLRHTRARGAVAGMLVLFASRVSLAQQSAPTGGAPVAAPVLDAERAPEAPRASPVVVGPGGSTARPMPVSTALFIAAGVTGGATSLLVSISVALEASNALRAGGCAVRTAGSVIVGGAAPECPPPTPTTGWWIASSIGLAATLALVVSAVALREPEPARTRAVVRPRFYADGVEWGVRFEGAF